MCFVAELACSGLTSRVVLPLIVTCMIIAVQRLKEMSKSGGSLAKWCILWYVGTTFVALLPSVLLASLVWAKLYPVASAENLVVAAADQATIAEREKLAVYQVVINLIDSFVTNNSKSAGACLSGKLR